MGLKYINLIPYTSKGYIFMKKLKELLKKYNHVWVLLYALLYMPWFTYLERHVTADLWNILSFLICYGSYILQPVHVFFFSRTKKGSCRQPDLQSAV